VKQELAEARETIQDMEQQHETEKEAWMAGYEVQEREVQELQLLMEELGHRLDEDGLKFQEERRDLLNQMDAKDEEIRLAQETVDQFSLQLEDQERHFQRRLSQAVRDRDATLQVMANEGENLQARIDKP